MSTMAATKLSSLRVWASTDRNARAFFLATRTPYRQNEGGFTLGGPVLIPHVYDGRNKTFFFASLGLYYSRVGSGGSIVTIPTPAFMAGDFSGLVTASGAQIPIYDPLSSQPDGKGSYVRTPFPGNIIPTNRIGQAANIIASYIPDRKSTRLNSSHLGISYAVFCLKKK